jgi:hypothetical protein
MDKKIKEEKEWGGEGGRRVNGRRERDRWGKKRKTRWQILF